VPVWLIVLAVSIVTYVISYVLIRTISRYREIRGRPGLGPDHALLEKPDERAEQDRKRITQIPQQDLRQVAGMNAFFIVPTNWRVNTSASSSWITRRSRAHRGALRYIAREMGRPVS